MVYMVHVSTPLRFRKTKTWAGGNIHHIHHIHHGRRETASEGGDVRTIRYQGDEYRLCCEGLLTERYERRMERYWKRTILRGAPAEEHVEACMTWLRKHATPRARVNKRVDSYALKHVIEEEATGGYVTNGSLIEAVIRLGWDVVPEGPNSYNAYFRLSYHEAVE